MTKKFWNNWQKRIGETKNIQLFYVYPNGSKRKSYELLNNNAGDSLIKADFHGDLVDLIIERHNIVMNWKTLESHQHIENEYRTLHREDIATIEFIKY